MESLDSGHTTVKTENSSRVSIKARTLAHESHCGVPGWLQSPFNSPSPLSTNLKASALLLPGLTAPLRLATSHKRAEAHWQVKWRTHTARMLVTVFMSETTALLADSGTSAAE